MVKNDVPQMIRGANLLRSEEADSPHTTDDGLERRAALVLVEQVHLVDEEEAHRGDQSAVVAPLARQRVPLLRCRQHQHGPTLALSATFDEFNVFQFKWRNLTLMDSEYEAALIFSC